MSYIVITVWELLIRTIYLYQTPAVRSEERRVGKECHGKYQFSAILIRV